MIYLWNIIFYEPLYNALFWLVGVLPQNSLFIAVIILTIIVRVIISPLSYKALHTQIRTKTIQPELRAIKKETDNKQEQARKTLEVYKKNGINPFSGFLLLLVQFPIIIALYWVFRDGGLEIDPSILYSFVEVPASIMRESFGINLSEQSIVLALLAGVTQYIHLARSQSLNLGQTDESASEQEKMMAKIGSSMKYLMPIAIVFFAYFIGAAVSLYWVTSNIFMIIQEHFIYAKLRARTSDSTNKDDSVEAEIVEEKITH
jgi:YidC/Oxa1 family membrane protein insertase